ncbi:MAG: hypothetical protein IPM63_14710 [Acidobacteriota bacterium]|nr:MAG: hypothetical protein IPM63_14710 [Acidobacteriota bacterium]
MKDSLKQVRLSVDEFNANGFFVLADVIDEETRTRLIAELPPIEESGTRTLLENQAFAELARGLRNSESLNKTLAGLSAVQCTYFRKTPEHNWAVRLHRDLVIPVNGSGPWKSAGKKEGLSTVSADVEFLNRCVGVRVHLDGAPSGDINVVPGSHRDRSEPDATQAVAVPVERLGALVMKPTLLHGSSKLAQSAGQRRVLHYLFAPAALPGNFSWHVSV